MKKFVFLFLAVGFSLPGFAQLDRSKGSNTGGVLKIPAVEEPVSEPKKEEENPFSKMKDPDFNVPERSVDFMGAERKPFSMRTDNGLMTYELKDFTPKAFTKDKEVDERYAKDQNLGHYMTTGNYVELYCRDHEYVDGDLVKVFVNGNLIQHSVRLGGGYTPILVKLKTGVNTIEFVALNQGTSGPNTAELKIYDSVGQPLAHREWNLLTGATASLVVVKN